MLSIEGNNIRLNPAFLHAEEPVFEKFLKTSTQQIHKVTSQQQAQAFVQDTMGPFVPNTSGQHIRSGQPMKYPLPGPLKEKMVKLTKEIATWQFASQVEKQLILKEPGMAHPLSPSVHHSLNWLVNLPFSKPFHQVLSLTNAYFELKKFSNSKREDLPRFAEYAQHLQIKYPNWKNHNDRLFAVAEKEGASGIIQRLKEYWERNNSKELSNIPVTPAIQKSYSSQYLQQYYLPLHKAYLLTTLVRLQMKTKQHAWVLWNELQRWKTDQKHERGLLRLCGTWQWIIHNHQNHGDHKTIMIYPPPSQYDRMDPKPTKIQVQGNTVYIRWEFPRGIIQEESLLLSEEDQLLSGTFVNNLGPNGSITGRRLKPCQKK